MKTIPIGFGPDDFYEDLNGRRWALASFSMGERKFLRQFAARANRGTAWGRLTSSWRSRLLTLYRGRSRRDVVRQPLYAICQDIDARVGIRQGFFRQRDYRDDLAEVIRHSAASRYRFAKRARLDQSLLSRVLGKRAHLSVHKLDAVLIPLGYRVALVPAAVGRRRR